ncbi:MAG: PD40 domain-containing protein [Planctomycetales bacterium]|nr:PD40 domain-containing protein [Planctomycetales bacterium]
MSFRSPSRFVSWPLLVLAAFALAYAAAPAAAEPIEVAAVAHEGAVDFEKEILPILRKNCLACHNASDAESDLVLETPATILKGGSIGPGVVPGKSAESLLLQVSAHQDDPVMPPEDNDRGATNLTPQELGLLKLWIDQGAKGEVTGGGPIEWRRLPDAVNPIYALALSPEGRFVACGRANQLYIYHVASGQLVGQPVDPELQKGELYQGSGAAHLDMIQSIAFHPSGDLLATGGFRNVKLWRRGRNTKLSDAAIEDVARSFALSNDGQKAAFGLANGKIVIWEVASSTPVRTLEGHGAEVTGVAFSADNAQLVSASKDKTLRAWKVDDGTALGSLETPAPVTAIALVGAEMAQLVAAGEDHVIRLWDVATITSPPAAAPAAEGEQPAEPAGPPIPVREMKGHSQPITVLARLLSAPTQFISASQDGILRHWESTDGRELRQVNHGGPIRAAAVSADGKKFATASDNKTARLWNAENGQQIAEVKGDYRASDAASAADRTLVLARAEVEYRKRLAGEAENRVKSETEGLKKAEEALKAAQEEAKKKTDELAQPTKDKEAADKAATEAAEKLKQAQEAKTSAEKAVADTAEAVKQATEAVQKAQQALDADKENKGLADAKAAADKALQEANQKKAEADKQLQTANQAAQQAENENNQAAKKAEETDKKFKEAQLAKQRADSLEEGAARSVEASKQALQKANDAVPVAKNDVTQSETELKQSEEAKAAADKTVGESPRPYTAIAFSADGQSLAIGSEEGKILIVDANTAEPIDALEQHAGAVFGLQYLNDTSLLSFGADKKVVRWQAQPTWTLERTIGAVDDPDSLADRVMALAFSPDGSLLATGSGEPSRSGQLKIWNPADGQLVREIPEAHSDTIFDLAFSPDGKYVATAAADRFAKVFQVADGQLSRSLEGHTHHVLSIAWKADGRELATAGADTEIKVWNFTTGEQARTIKNYGKEVTSITYQGTGDDTLSCSGDKTVRVFRSSNGGQVRTFGGAADFMYCADASADGKIVVAAGQASIIRIWNGQNAQAIQTLAPPAADDKLSAN